MTVKVYNAATEETETFTGTPEQLIAQLDIAYPFLKRYSPNGLQDMLKHLGRQQLYFVTVEQ
jgi:hypothetical protein